MVADTVLEAGSIAVNEEDLADLVALLVTLTTSSSSQSRAGLSRDREVQAFMEEWGRVRLNNYAMLRLQKNDNLHDRTSRYVPTHSARAKAAHAHVK